MHKILLIITFLSSMLMMQAKEQPYMVRYLISYPITIEKEAIAPFHWQEKDWLTAGAIAVVGTGLYLKDEQINDWVQDNKNHFNGEASKIGNTFGNETYMLPTAGAVWLAGYAFGSEKTQDTGAMLVKTMLIAGRTTALLKYATQRNRPLALKGNEFWLDSHVSRYRNSFPSGHATIAFSTATILAEQYKSTVWVPIIAYSGATLTCYSRLHDLKHWSSDVIMGSVVGYFTAQMVLKTTPKLYVAPSSKLNEISFEYKF